MNVVVMAARERIDSDEDRNMVESLLAQLKKRYKRHLNVVSIGCDRGIGKFTKEYCIKNNIIFAECRMKLEGRDAHRTFFAHLFQARNAALLELGDEFYVFKGPNLNGIVEGIVEPAQEKVNKGSENRVHVYEYDNQQAF